MGRFSRTLVASALVAVACAPAPERHAQRVIWITCDTLRADRLGVYGNERGLTPNLDRFAREGVVFDEAYTTAPMTLPAVSSMLTGRLPQEIGVDHDNRRHMPESVVTLTEELAGAGLETAAVVSNWILRRLPPEVGNAGVQQGFAHFDDRMDTSERNRDHLERSAAKTTDAAIEWLSAAPRDRFFLWVHYQDPHGPYEPPQEFAPATPAPETSAAKPLRLGKSRFGFRQIPDYQIVDGERRADVYRARYDGEVRYFDHEAGRLLDWLAQRGLLADALVVFTADHGESLGEHDFWFCHGESVHRELVRVPLVIRYPEGMAVPHDVERGGVRHVERPVGHVDLRATSLAALGLDADPARGVALRSESPPEERLFGQFLLPAPARTRWSAVSDGRWRAVWTEGAKGHRLYDVQADPEELVDLSAREPQRVLDLLARHAELLRSNALPPMEGVLLLVDDEEASQLEALGYAGDEDE